MRYEDPMSRAMRWLVVVGAVLACLGGVASCSQREQGPGALGSGAAELRTATGKYRLAGVLTLTQQTDARVFEKDLGGDADRVIFFVPAGTYTPALAAGWTLTRLDGATAVDVTPIVQDEPRFSPSPIAIVERETSPLVVELTLAEGVVVFRPDPPDQDDAGTADAGAPSDGGTTNDGATPDAGDTTASPPLLTTSLGLYLRGGENTAILLGIGAVLTDTDGSETLSVAIRSLPGWGDITGAQLTDGIRTASFAGPSSVLDVTGWNLGSISVRPPPGADNDLALEVTARSTETAGGATAAVSANLTVTVITEGTGVVNVRSVDQSSTGDGARIIGEDIVEAISTSGLAFAVDTGDFNGDGYPDLALGAPTYGQNGVPVVNAAGAVYVVLGGPAGFPSTLRVIDLDGSNGFRIDGYPGTNLGGSVNLSGDLDGDGFSDLIASDFYGATHAIYGRPGPFPASFGLDGEARLRDPDLYFDVHLATADVDGDGLDDLLMGSPDLRRATLLYGKRARFQVPLDRALLDGTNGTRIEGASFERFGSSVANAGDVNGDGYADLVIAATADNGQGSGRAFVIFGARGGLGAEVDAGALDGTNGFSIVASVPADALRLGFAVSSSGDMNRDGLDDVAITAPGATSRGDPEAGACFVVFGRAGAFGAAIDASTLDGSAGFRIDGAEAFDRFGSAVASAGDLNLDGFDELVIGAEAAARPGYRIGPVGESYVIQGRTSFPASIDVTSLAYPEGARVEGGNQITDAAPLGDVNDDGFPDFVLGGGAAYVLGGAMFGQLDRGVLYGSDGNDVLVGSGLGVILLGKQGDDVLDGGAGDDTLLGGTGNDVLVYSSFARLLSGGPGFDTLRVSGALDLTELNAAARYRRIVGIEQIDLRDAATTTLRLGYLDVIHLSQEAVAPIGRDPGLVIRGEPGDVVVLEGDFGPQGGASFDGKAFTIYGSSRGAAIVWVEQGVEMRLP